MTSLPAAAVVASATRRSQLRHDGEYLYWLEQRPEQKGRGVLMRWSVATGFTELTPDTLSVRSRVHEYGGGEFAVRAGELVFIADPDQCLWRRTVAGELLAITPAHEGIDTRYGDFCWHPTEDWLCAVRERHAPDGVHNELVALTLTGQCKVLASGADFYAAPCFAPDGRQLAWLQWSHPQMPWDGTELKRAEVAQDLTLQNLQTLCGGPEESVLQPGFDRHGRLFAISDRNGFWQLGRVEQTGWQPVCDVAGEMAVAPWSLGCRTWCQSADERIYCIVSNDGSQQLWRFDTDANSDTSTVTRLPLEPKCLAPHLASDGDALYVLMASTEASEALVRIALDTGDQQQLLAAAAWPTAIAITPAESRRVTVAGRVVPYFFYQPKGSAQSATPPPLLLLCHSGPTGAATPALQASIQFWTSRGFAVADVNYRGSDGFGRQWRQSLLGHWGQFDVADCESVINTLVARGDIDGSRVFVRGNSAGGLTVLQLLAQGVPVRAAAVRYPVVDLVSLAAESHKFEAEYLLRLVGATATDRSALFAASPARQFDRIRTPMLIQHGSRDPVVPLAQAQQLVAALVGNGVAHQLVVFDGEGHGFRSAETLTAALQNELDFFLAFS